MTTRRQFLWGSGGLLAASTLGVRTRAMAAGSAKHLVVVVADGGWDPTYCLDPKLGLDDIDGPDLDEDPTKPQDRESLVQFGGSTIAVNPHKRPSVRSFFEAWGPNTAVVNGLYVGSITHAACKVRMMTGSQDVTNADMATLAGYHLGGDRPIGCMDLSGLGFPGPYAASTGRTGRNNQIKLLLDRNARLFSPTGAPITYPQFVGTSVEQEAMAAFRATRDVQFAARRGEVGGKPYVDYLESLSRRERLLAEGKDFASSIEFGTQVALNTQSQMVSDLLKSELCMSVCIDSGPTWDTHDDIADQHDFYETLFSGLNKLMDELQDNGLLNDTVVVVLSEMGRTPKRNADDGKDHWPTTSAMVIGTDIAGGTTYGGTDNGLDALTVNLTTGALDPSGSSLKYDNFCAGVLEAVGVESSTYLPEVEVFRALVS
jgi:hypothetical protein